MKKKIINGLVGGLVLILFLNLVVKPLLNEGIKRKEQRVKKLKKKRYITGGRFCKKVEGEILLQTEDINSSEEKLENERKLSSNEIFRCIFTDTISNLDKPYTVSINILNETGMGSGTGKYQLEVSITKNIKNMLSLINPQN